LTAAWLLLGVAALLIVGNAIFVAAETGLVTADRTDVESRARQGDRRFQRIAGTLRRLSTYLSGAQLGITVTSLAIGLVAEPSAAQLLRGPLQAVGFGNEEAEVVAVAVALLLATGVQMVFGELVPKNIALSKPIGTVSWVVPALVVFTTLARPLIAALNGAANQLLRLAGIEPVEELRSARTPDELASVVRRAGAEGALAGDTAVLLERSLSFRRKTAADAMTPRTRMQTVAASSPLTAVIEATRATGHSRFPVTGEDVDDVRGLIHVKNAVAVPAKQRTSTRVAEVMAAPVVVTEFLHLDQLLSLLQQRGLQLAAVADEYGGTAGLITFEDLVEELVGDIVDEHDAPAPGARHDETDGSWAVSGLLRPDEVLALTGVELPEGHSDYDTVAGLVLHRLGRLPNPGDEIDLPQVKLTVVRLDGRRIDRVRLAPHATDPGDNPGADQERPNQ
jgi:CBS domain containing-hemolysin-like protein